MVPGPTQRPRRRCLVIGGGIAGLTAAHVLSADPAYDVVLLESTAQVGGKLRGAEVGSVCVDVGAEAMLHRRPEGSALAREVGLAIVHPTSARPRVWTRGELRPLPRTLMGIPQDLDSLAASGVLSSAGVDRVHEEARVAPQVLAQDVSVGALVAQRMGEEVVDRLVEPLLGGVYAGRAYEISARAAIPALVAQAERGSWLSQAAAPQEDQPAPVFAAPVFAAQIFAGIPGGLWQLPESLAASGRFAVHVSSVVRRISRAPGGFLVEHSTPRGEASEFANDVVIATPAAPSAKLLAQVLPRAAAELAQIESASVAVVTLAVAASAVDSVRISGFLVPPPEPLGIKAATFSWAKWEWVRAAGIHQAGNRQEEVALVRASWGRHRDELVLQCSDAELVARTQQDLATCGVLAPVVESHVQRWGGGLPQYAVGHLDRVARIRAAIAAENARAELSGEGRLAVCGAAYDGVGIAAVIASARRAVAEVAAQ